MRKENIYSVFLNKQYYHNFIALFNSYRYYENKVPLRVYAIEEKDKSFFKEIEKHCEIIDVTKYKHLVGDNFFNKYLFKLVALQNEMKDNEIILDADTLFLSNLDYLFEDVSNGIIIGAKEAGSDLLLHAHYDTNSQEWKDVEDLIRRKLEFHLGEEITRKSYHEDFFFPVLNAGLLGFNKEKHMFLIEKSIDLLMDEDFQNPAFFTKNPVFALEQYMLSFLMEILKLPKNVLPYDTWMNTWHAHRNPKKFIAAENGKLILVDENKSRVNFYHFTGGLALEDEKLAQTIPGIRTFYIYENTYSFSEVIGRREVELLWYKKHENPALLLYEYFHDKGL